ncbi:MAG: SDR family NAD(P)-dependent oxidoreductase, partial [Thermomicrobiales bacterium]
MRLAEKVILVTGAASGMGLVATRMVAAEGAKVIAADLNAAGLEAAVAGLDPALAGSVLTVAGSVTDSGDVGRMVAEGTERFGKLNVLYNNAGIMPEADTSVVETSEDVWAQIL